MRHRGSNDDPDESVSRIKPTYPGTPGSTYAFWEQCQPARRRGMMIRYVWVLDCYTTLG
jgi:hypothetical protein